jgi:hypothetical protein
MGVISILMPILHLGVADIPYVSAPTARQNKVTAGTVTTGDVAGWLEDEYHILEIFGRVHEQDMAADLEHGMAGALESLMMGAPPSLDPYGAGASKIEERMKNFISDNEMASLGYPGVPTQAALDRASGKKRSARMARARKSNAKPVSFIDSGLMQSSYKAWVE